ncbi:unnamed protein product [Colias eurytheme]|nr:unnamed protein product [Colias eurytheme]
MDKTKRSAAVKKMINLLKICRRNITEDKVKNKINILRTSFKRENNKVKKTMLSGSGTDDLYVPTLWYYKELEFLQDQMEEESGISTVIETQRPKHAPEKYGEILDASDHLSKNRHQASNFMDNLAPSTAREFIQLKPPIICSMDHNYGSLLASPFILDELKGVLSSVKDSAPGLDGIPYSFLSHLSENCLNYYLDLINSIMISGNVPLSWKSQEIIPILKPNKSPTAVSSYRPVALSSVLTKSQNMVVADFSENYNCKYHQETQAHHFGGSRQQDMGKALQTALVVFLKRTADNMVATGRDIVYARQFYDALKDPK